MRSLLLTLCVAGCRMYFDDVEDVAPDANADSTITSEARVWSHMPSACALHVDTLIDRVPPARWGVNPTVEAVADSTAPYDAPVARFTYPIGFSGGSPGVLWFSQPEIKEPELPELYIGLVWKVSDPWQSHGSNYNTIYYVHDSDGTNQSLDGMYFHGAEPPYQVHALHDTLPLSANVANVPLALGTWHVAEFHRVASTTTTSADGLVEWWLDGELIGRHTNLNFRHIPLLELLLSPAWGGTGSVKAETDYFWMARVMICMR